MADEWNFVNRIPVLGHIIVAVQKKLNQEKEAKETLNQALAQGLAEAQAIHAIVLTRIGKKSGNQNSMSMQNKAEEYNGNTKRNAKSNKIFHELNYL